MASTTSTTTPDPDPLYGSYTRFELELEFVQSLSNPYYLNHLASTKLLQNPNFVAYLAYLQYWALPEYTKYLTYPGPTLKALELLQREGFRRDVLSPETVRRLVVGGLGARVGEGDLKEGRGRDG
ncbi:mediator of rna polymerase ii transcription subunit 31 [Lasallia pustulata]|uniref:Mediator of RNA polymerase II transcription subunit 31 n=1 Tax=Lasallia pustulata TaxID=136370 RepID=A0A1W5DB06_9LECA|nr:mediator of rna polymerase ii transcription subunit 31 [Lasallia pustulata]